MDFAEQKALKMLYLYKIKDKEEHDCRAKEIENEFHSGLMDPVRCVAAIEKQLLIKKNVGKKKKMNEVGKRTATRQENKL